MTREVAADGGVTVYDYSDLPQGCTSCSLTRKPSRVVDPKGRRMDILYDSEGRVLSRSMNVGTPQEETTTFAYDLDNRVTSVTGQNGVTVTHTYNDHGQVTATRESTGFQLEQEYDERGRLLTIKDQHGRETRMTYDAEGRVLSTELPDGRKTSREYDARGRVTKAVAENGSVTTFDYDAEGRLARRIDARGAEEFSYTLRGQVASITYSDGTKRLWRYDLAGRPTTMTTPDGLEVRYAYDARNRIAAISDYTGRAVSVERDARGRVAAATDPLGRVTRWSFDEENRLVEFTGADGYTERKVFGADGRIAARVDRAGNRLEYTYDAKGHLATMRDPIGNIISYGRDAKNGEISLRHADGTTETWATDESSRQSRFTNRAGQVQTTTHNTEGRPATKSWSPAGAAPAVTYAYDVAGRTIAADNGNAKLTYTYDKAGRLQSETTDLSALVPGLAPQTVTYQYDMHGHRVTTGYPDRLSVLHEHDLQGRMVGVRLLGQPRLATYAYDSIGRRAIVTRDNSITSTYVYDAVNQVRQITHANAGGTVASAQYRYDPLDRRTSRITEDGRSEEYAYDLIGQLTEVVRRAGGGAPVDRRIDYRYDGAGNRREVSETHADGRSSAAIYQSDAANRYTMVQGGTSAGLIYDRNGNLTRGPEANGVAAQFTYDAENRLVSVLAGAERLDLFYDPAGRCVLRRRQTRAADDTWALDANGSRVLTHDSDWNLLSERRLDGTQTAAYIHGPLTDEIVAVITSAGTFYPLADALGSTTALIDRRGAVVERFAYDAFGAPMFMDARYVIRPASALGHRFLFTGREWLGTGEIYDYRHRAYLPALGKFLQPDPLRLNADRINFTRYVQNNPVSRVDPLGLYQTDGHFHGVYLVAKANGFASSGGGLDDASLLAYWSEYPDEDSNFDAITNAINSLFPWSDVEFNFEVMRVLHSIHGGNNAKIVDWRACLKNKISTGALLPLWKRGMLIHAFGDAYAHVKNIGGTPPQELAYKPRLGHLWDGVTPDIPQYMPNKSKIYLTELGSALGSASFSTVYNAITWLADSPYASNGSDSPQRKEAALRYIKNNPNLSLNEPYLPNPAWAYPANGYNPDDPNQPNFNPALGTISGSDAKTFLQQIAADCWCP